MKSGQLHINGPVLWDQGHLCIIAALLRTPGNIVPDPNFREAMLLIDIIKK